MAEQQRVQFERHMSDSEALMWNIEKDPAMSSWFATITYLDVVPDWDRVRARWSHVVAQVPRLRQRVVATVGRMSPPMWVEDPDFDLDYHVRRIAVPPPGTEAELHELAATLLLDPFERSRALWQVWIIEGLADGRAALFQKMHHTITDGEGGLRLSLEFVDFERDADDPEPVDLAALIAESIAREEAGEDGFDTSVREMVRHNVNRVAGVGQRAVRNIVTDPVRSVAGVGEVIGELSKALRPDAGDGVHVGSELWRPRTLRRWFGTLRYPLEDVKAAGKALGGTVNDLFVAGALAGTAAYHAERDALPGAFRAAMPVSTRTRGSAGGNQFALTTTDLPAVADPVEAFAVVKDSLTAAKSGSSIDVLGALSMIINLLPTSVLTAFAKDTAATVDFTTSNVRGSPVPLYMSGARIDGVFPMGPISGTGFNLTTMSYAGNLDMGLVVDAGAVAEPEALHAAIGAAYEKLLAER